MIKCPECDDEIEWVIWAHNVVVTDAISWDDETMLSERLGEDEEDDDGVFLCPWCDKIVAYNLKEAKVFLKDE